LVTFCQYITATLPSAKLIVSTVQPAGPAGSASAVEAEQYNALILGGITPVGPNVSTVDISSAMTYEADIGPDGVHPNVAGNQVIANVFFAGIQKVFPMSAPTVVFLTLSSGGSITDSAGNVWTLTASGSVMENGVATPGGGGTSAITYQAGTIYGRDATTGNWYSYTVANGWQPGSPPVLPGPTPTPTPTPVPTPTPTPTPTPPPSPTVASVQAEIDAVTAALAVIRTNVGLL
jgi:hypothetical protein